MANSLKSESNTFQNHEMTFLDSDIARTIYLDSKIEQSSLKNQYNIGQCRIIIATSSISSMLVVVIYRDKELTRHQEHIGNFSPDLHWEIRVER